MTPLHSAAKISPSKICQILESQACSLNASMKWSPPIQNMVTYIYPIVSISSIKLYTLFQHASLFGFFKISDKKITHNNPIRKMNHFFQIQSVCTCARNMYILALAGCAPKETCEIALKMRECCQQSCKLCCKMTKMMAFNLDDYFPLHEAQRLIHLYFQPKSKVFNAPKFLEFRSTLTLW